MDEFFYQNVNAGLARMFGRADANETLIFSRELLQVVNKTYDVVYPEMKARLLFPVDRSIDTGADKYAYHQYDYVGRAKVVANYAKDFPSVGVTGKEFILPIVPFGASYNYSVQDMRAAAFARKPLDSMLAKAVRETMERSFEEHCAYGNSALNMPGFASAPATLNIPETTATGTNWTTGTVADILADVRLMSSKVFTQSKGRFRGDTLLLGTTEYAAAATRTVAEAYASNVTILQFLLQSNPWLKSIEHWVMLDNADGGTLGEAGPTGGASRKFLYQKDQDIASAVIPQEFEQFAPQQEGMAFVVNCHARYGGVRVTYPLGITFMDLT